MSKKSNKNKHVVNFNSIVLGGYVLCVFFIEYFKCIMYISTTEIIEEIYFKMSSRSKIILVLTKLSPRIQVAFKQI